MKNALIEVQGDIYNVQNIEDDKVEELILSLRIGSQLSIRWVGMLEVKYYTTEPYYDINGTYKSIITLYCDKVVA